MQKRFLTVLLLLLLTAVGAFANGNSERLSSVEGAAQFVPDGSGGTRLMLRAENGDTFAVDMPQGEILRLRLQDQERIRVRGIVVDDPAGTQAKVRILARVVTAKGNDVEVEEPVQLTDRDRDRIRLYESEGSGTKTRTQKEGSSGGSSQNGSGKR